jgi:hypothetical protein
MRWALEMRPRSSKARDPAPTAGFAVRTVTSRLCNCPERAGTKDKYVDRGTSKKLTGVNRDVEFRHNPNSKRNPGEQDAKKRGTKRVFGPTQYIKGVHTQCEHVINGKRCNKHHLRRDCEEFKELHRLARETVAIATEEDEEDTVGCIFDVTAGECTAPATIPRRHQRLQLRTAGRACCRSR